MKLSKKTKTNENMVLSEKADDIVIKDIDLSQHIIICDLTKGIEDDAEYLARDRYFSTTTAGKTNNFPGADLTLTEINTIPGVE